MNIIKQLNYKYMTEVREVIIHKVDFKNLLKNSNITLIELSRKAGVNYTQLSKIFNSRVRVSLETWNKIKKVLDEATTNK